MAATSPAKARWPVGGWLLAALTACLGLAGLMAGSEGWDGAAMLEALRSGDESGAGAIVADIRAPRTLGAWGVGALLGLAGAIAQGLFRNPLADPYLLGSAAGASLGVVLVLALTAGVWGTSGAWFTAAADSGIPAGLQAMGSTWQAAAAGLGLSGGAFAGALAGMMLTLALARGATQTMRLLLSGVVVGVLLTAVNDLVATTWPELLRGRQGFLLGHTGFIGWGGVAGLALCLAVALPVAMRLTRLLDALVLGEDGARSLGLDVSRGRAALVGVLALATGVAVAQAGLVAFVGLVAPHLVRRWAPGTHAHTVPASAAMGGALLLAADVGARVLLAPRELPVGLLTAVLGGGYLLWLLQRGVR
jgi:iron complex transport system permease protein